MVKIKKTSPPSVWIGCGLLTACGFIKSEECVSVKVHTISHNSWVIAGYTTSDPTASLQAYCHTKRWKMEMQALWTASHWDKAGPLLTRPRPSPRIFPPTSIDYVVGGRAVSSFFFPLPLFQHCQELPLLMLAISPNDIFAINCLLHRGSIIWAWHNQWRWPHWMGHYLKKNTTFCRQQSDHLKVILQPLCNFIWFDHVRRWEMLLGHVPVKSHLI